RVSAQAGGKIRDIRDSHHFQKNFQVGILQPDIFLQRLGSLGHIGQPIDPIIKNQNAGGHADQNREARLYLPDKQREQNPCQSKNTDFQHTLSYSENKSLMLSKSWLT